MTPAPLPKPDLKRNVVLTLGRQLGAALLQLGTFVVIARALGPQGNGLYAMTVLLPNLLTALLNLGVAPANVYFLGRRQFDASAVGGTILRIGCALSLAGAALAAPLIFFWHEQLFPGVPQSLLWLGLLAFPCALIQSLLQSILQGTEQFGRLNRAILISPTVTFLAVLVAVVLLNGGAKSAVVAFLGGQAVGLAWLIWLLRGTFVASRADAAAGYASRAFGYGWKAHLSNILTFINYRADIYLVNLLLGPAAVGLYVIAVQLSERLWILSQAVSTVILPRLSAMHGDQAERLALTMSTFRVTVLLTAAACLLLGFLAYPMIALIFGSKFLPAFLPLLVLLPGILAGAGFRVLANSIAAQGRPELNAYVAALVVVVNVVGNLLLIPAYGLVGAALATTFAYSLNLIFGVVIIGRLEGASVLTDLVPRPADALRLVHAAVAAFRRSRAAAA